MHSFKHITLCPECGEEMVLHLCANAEQRGGLETEYIPAYLEYDSAPECECGHELTKAEAEHELDRAAQELPE